MNINKTKQNKYPSGVTLIEALVLLFIFSLLTITFYSVISAGTHNIIEVKNKLGATAIANEKMEIVRNLDYDDIGTTTGIPHGNLLQTETVTRNTHAYYIFTFVQYVDDPFDGKQGGSPNDTIPNDYKRVRIQVAWENNIDSPRSVSLVSTFPPRGIETSSGGGTLSVNILDTKGIGIPQADVHIVNSVSGIDISTQTDNSGNIMLPAAPAGTQRYVISVSESGYLPVTTLPPYPTTSYNPVDLNASVVAGTMNVKSIVTDRLSSFNLHFKDPFGTAIPNVNFSMYGGRIMGQTRVAPITNVYSYPSANLSSDSSGEKEFSNVSYGSYYIAITGSDYTLIKADPGMTNNKGAFDALPGADSDINVIAASNSLASALVTVERISDSSVISNATVELKDPSGYDVTLTTDAYGQAYFPTALPALTPGTFELKVSAAGFNNNNSMVTIGSALLKQEVKLTPQ